MGESHAVKVFQTIPALLARQKLPHGRIWGGEMYLEKRLPLPASKNKFLEENVCELIAALDRRDMETVGRILDFMAWTRTAVPFTDGEDLTCEEIYRAAMAYSYLVAAAVADTVGSPHAQPIAEMARAHVAWLAAGVGAGPGRVVLDHQKGSRGGVVLIGQGKNKTGLPYVAQAGLRGCIRSETNEFRFTNRTTLSIILCQAIGRAYKPSSALTEHEIFDGVRRRFPAAPIWGFSGEDLARLRAFVSSPVETVLAIDLSRHLLAPSLPVRVDRFEDGSVVFMLEANSPSSTDPWVIDAWYAGGETRLASCEDGRRSSKSRQVATEETDAYVARFAAGGGQPVRVAKPTAREVYSIRADGTRTWVEHGGETPRPELQSTPPEHAPPPVADRPRRRRRFNFS